MVYRWYLYEHLLFLDGLAEAGFSQLLTRFVIRDLDFRLLLCD